MIKLNYKDIELNIDEKKKTAYLYGTYLRFVDVQICFMNYGKIDEIETLQVMDGISTMEPWFLTEFRGLKRLILTDSISSFAENYSFSLRHCLKDCNELDYLKLPAGIKRVTSNVLPCVKEVYVPAGITAIDKFAFSNIYRLENIIVDDNNQDYKSVNGVLFTKNGLSLLAFPCGRGGDYTVPDETMEIASGAFDASGIDNILLHENITIIGEYSFRNCHNLTSIKLPDKLRLLSQTAFDGCEKLNRIECNDSCRKFQTVNGELCSDDGCEVVLVPKTTSGEYKVRTGISILGERAFSGSRITKIDISEYVLFIRDYCFKDCINLEEVIIRAQRPYPTVGKYIFSGCKNLKCLRYYASDPDFPNKCCYGEADDEIIYAPNVMLSKVSKGYFAAVAAGFISMIVHKEHLREDIFEDVMNDMRKRFYLLHQRALLDKTILDFLLQADMIPYSQAFVLFQRSQKNNTDEGIQVALKEYLRKYESEEDTD
ncbi:leucine-rich repeat domain-containing protein [Ruminococcus sp.]|uniref:leucine-rich repeat domain-containing protein n=1 Tax=Ruminococcus sp. TaxID=41978 RepID=UPI0025ED052D|nr:leucine-rich repeat domain-containing protein [Ruminococcus sp.]MBR1433097.1 leucine-rich repeat protein [Ruminococcus sp.]